MLFEEFKLSFQNFKSDVESFPWITGQDRDVQNQVDFSKTFAPPNELKTGMRLWEPIKVQKLQKLMKEFLFWSARNINVMMLSWPMLVTSWWMLNSSNFLKDPAAHLELFLSKYQTNNPLMWSNNRRGYREVTPKNAIERKHFRGSSPSIQTGYNQCS